MKQNAIALGTFDGLHLGHRAVLEQICRPQFHPVAVTFRVPPRFLKDNRQLRLLLTPDEKEKRLREMGISVFNIDFDMVKDILPVEFLDYLINTYDPALIATGFNFRFGKNAQGSVVTISEYCKKRDVEFVMVDPIVADSDIVSSTRIRTLIERGSVNEAAALLGYEFSFCGEVIHGNERGRTIGFPTINQVYPQNLVLPRFGVYKSKTFLQGKWYNSVSNIGIRPTFKNGMISCESHIINYSGNAYGKTAVIKLKDFLRDEIKFENIEQLRKQISADISGVCGGS